MDSLYNIGTAILFGIVSSIKGAFALFYLDKEANRKNSPPPRVNRLDPTTLGGRATKESLSTPSVTTQQHQNFNKDNVKRKDESNVMQRVLQCCVLNGVILTLSIVAYRYTIQPGLSFLFSYLFSNTRIDAFIQDWVMPTITVLFHGFWVIPLYVLTKIVNSIWFQDIADSAYKISIGRPQLISSISKLIADTCISFLIQVLFLVQGGIIKFIPFPVPFVGTILSIVHMSLLYSLYAFEYKWFNMGWELHKRLTYIETNWPFFIGFGLPLAIMCELPDSYIISGCVFSVLFPLFIISANEATPRVSVCQSPLKLFSLVVAITNALFSRFSKLNKAALSTPRSGNPGSPVIMGRGMTPPLSGSTPTPSLNFQLNQQQKNRQHHHRHRQSHRMSPTPSVGVDSVGGSTLSHQQQQPQALVNRSFRR